MSQVDEASNGEFAMAVAAAAHAINSLEGREGSSNMKKQVEGLQSTKIKSRKESSTSKRMDSSRTWRWFSGEETEDKESTGKLPSLGVPNGSAGGLRSALTKSSSKQENGTHKPTVPTEISRWFSGKEGKDEELAGKLEGTEKKMLEDQTSNQKSGKEIVTVPSIKKTPTFTSKQQNGIGSRRFASEKEKITGQDSSAAVKTMTLLTGDQNLNLSTSGQNKTKADAWEQAEIAKIKKRHEKLCSKILEWENERKQTAKKRSERKEGQLDLRRAIALKEYQNELARTDRMVTRARAAADEKRRNDEQKTQEKANEIRSTGKIPKECFCF